MRLYELHINNFKFFPKQGSNSPLLKIDGNNLLIYGENGSGKSTIYWAIYTLLESAFKQGDEGKSSINKYFIKKGEFGLVNIHASKNHNAFIKAIIKDDLGHSSEYLIKGEDAVINAAQLNSAIRESNMASDFLNYRALFQLHNLKHTKVNDLFSWFKSDIFPYILIESIDRSKTVDEVFKSLNTGPAQVRDFDVPDTLIFPNPTMRTHINEAVQKDYNKYQKYERKVKKWNTKFKTYLLSINKRANEILQNDFHQNFETKLIFEPIKINVTAANIGWQNPKIKLLIPKYEGKRNVIKKAHSFLNEAKWSAIGLSIRFAIIEDWTNRPSTAELKLLTIDDMLISLDMSNRDVVLDLLLNRYAKPPHNYQIILMTHDRYFFELAKGKINATNSSNWTKLEMYEDEKNNKKFPHIIKSKTNLEKAESFFIQKEFAASANHLRKATECFVFEFVPNNKKYDRSFRPLNLSQLINKSRALARVNGWSRTIISDLDLMRTNIFNPGSHYDVYTPVFHTELKKAIETLKQVSTLSNIKL